MLKELSLKNFTAFSHADFKFCEGLNVIVGENGTGKTHVLKLGYLVSKIWHVNVRGKGLIGKEETERYIAEHLLDLFRVEKTGNLARTGSKKPAEVMGKAVGHIPSVTIRMPGEAPLPPIEDEIEWQFSFSALSRKTVATDRWPKRLTSNAYYGESVFLPSKEMLSFFEGFIALYNKRELSFDETFYDLALALSSSKLKEKPELFLSLVENLENVIGGKIVLDSGRFYTVHKKGKKREITLLAEGLRKIATLLQLIENGSLETGGTLFWDEPETNLNPRLIRLVAHVVHQLVAKGVQVLIATHSYFLLKELDLLCRKQAIEQALFSISKEQGNLIIHQGDRLSNLENIVALDEELAQYDREMELSNG
ncbi:AAA family ATPase [Thiolapillus sp.]|uniref:AAA family ATPase n=1 Tax=Thiolapillus sp. TaxID=2017437 RepID=UPI003AF991CB